MKFIAGISSGALLCLLAIDRPHAAAFVAPAASANNNNAAAFANSNGVIADAIRYNGGRKRASDATSSSTSLLMAESMKITMPALSSTMKEGRVVSWLKSEGDEIEAGEAIMVVESDKADMDVEAFEDGYLAKILTEEGETAEVGAVVALVAAEEGDIEAM